jgi:hypothetical protein
LAGRPEELTDRLLIGFGSLEVDVLSDVLRAVRLTGAVYFDLRARAPWVAETPPTSHIRDRIMPGFEHVISFHMVLNGSCWAYLAEDPNSSVLLETGDAVIFTSGDTHVMSTERGRRATPISASIVARRIGRCHSC